MSATSASPNHYQPAPMSPFGTSGLHRLLFVTYQRSSPLPLGLGGLGRATVPEAFNPFALCCGRRFQRTHALPHIRIVCSQPTDQCAKLHPSEVANLIKHLGIVRSPRYLIQSPGSLTEPNSNSAIRQAPQPILGCCTPARTRDGSHPLFNADQLHRFAAKNDRVLLAG